MNKHTNQYLSQIMSYNEYQESFIEPLDKKRQESSLMADVLKDSDVETFDNLFNKLLKENKLDKKYLAEKLSQMDKEPFFEQESREIDALLDE